MLKIFLSLQKEDILPMISQLVNAMSEAEKDPKVWRMVLDVLKPHEPALPEFAKKIGAMEGVEGVDVTLIEIDKETETLKITIDGDLVYEKIRTQIEDWGGVVHSVDQVYVGNEPK